MSSIIAAARPEGRASPRPAARLTGTPFRRRLDRRGAGPGRSDGAPRTRQAGTAASGTHPPTCAGERPAGEESAGVAVFQECADGRLVDSGARPARRVNTVCIVDSSASTRPDSRAICQPFHNAPPPQSPAAPAPLPCLSCYRVTSERGRYRPQGHPTPTARDGPPPIRGVATVLPTGRRRVSPTMPHVRSPRTRHDSACARRWRRAGWSCIGRSRPRAVPCVGVLPPPPQHQPDGWPRTVPVERGRRFTMPL